MQPVTQEDSQQSIHSRKEAERSKCFKEEREGDGVSAGARGFSALRASVATGWGVMGGSPRQP